MADEKNVTEEVKEAKKVEDLSFTDEEVKRLKELVRDFGNKSISLRLFLLTTFTMGLGVVELGIVIFLCTH